MKHGTVDIAVVVIARNEAENITRCLNSVAWAKELLVIDDHSTDSTVENARKLGASVLTHKFESFAKQRNWALEYGNLRSEWVLMLDADEAGTPELAASLSSSLTAVNEETVGFKMCRKTMFLGKWLKRSDGFPVWIMRLVRRGKGRFEDSGHGEVPVPKLAGEIGTINEPFLHYPFSKGLTDWVYRHIRYAENEARLELSQATAGHQGSLFSTRADERRRGLRTLSRRMPGRPVLRFLYQYLWKGGIFEGQAGLVFSFLMSMYEGLILVKRIELTRRDKGQSI